MWCGLEIIRTTITYLITAFAALLNCRNNCLIDTAWDQYIELFQIYPCLARKPECCWYGMGKLWHHWAASQLGKVSGTPVPAPARLTKCPCFKQMFWGHPSLWYTEVHAPRLQLHAPRLHPDFNFMPLYFVICAFCTQAVVRIISYPHHMWCRQFLIRTTCGADKAFLNDIAWCCIVFDCIAWYCTVLHGIAW